MKLIEIYNKVLNEHLYHGSSRDNIKWGDRDTHVDYNMLGYGIYLTTNKEEAINYAKSSEKYLHLFKKISPNMIKWDGGVPNNIIKHIKNDKNLYPITGEVKVDFEDGSVDYSDGTLEWDYLENPLPKWAIEDNAKAGYYLMKYDLKGNMLDEITYGLSKNDVMKIVNSVSPNGEIPVDPFKLFYGMEKVESLNNQNIFENFAHIYSYIYLKLKSTKETTLFFTKLGIDGVYYMDRTSDFDGDYNDNDETIVIYNPNKFKVVKTKKL